MSSTTVKDIATHLYTWAPPELAAKWDNVGLQLGDWDKPVKNVLLSLDADSDALAHVRTENCDLVITHHPIFFKPMKSLQYSSDMGKIIQTFMDKQCSLLSLHTNLDAADGGVNDALIGAFGINPRSGETISDGFGKWFELEPTDIKEFTELHPCQVRGYSGHKTVKKIGFLGGSGHGLVHDVQRLGLDVFITGEITYHDHVFCEMNGITVITLGHKESEVFVLPVIQERLRDAFAHLDISIIGI